MKKIQQGFTLIELMIVVAIVGILAAVALPAYQDYTKRAHVSEGLGLAQALMTASIEYYSDHGEWPKSVTQAGLGGTISGNAVTKVEVSDSDGTITITFNTKVKNNGTVTLTPDTSGGSIKWTCAGSSDVPNKWLPARCRS
jgi:type IV pilus assembly protein PilA